MCGIEFVLRFQATLLKRPRHYHDRRCFNQAKLIGGPTDLATKSTSLQKHGASCTFQSEHGKQKARATMLLKYGVEHPMLSREFSLKALNSVSYAESQFRKVLEQMFSNEAIETPKFINGWRIDFFIKTLNLYCQFDGVYWHGLDRPIDVIREFRTKRDRVIYATYERDKRQNEWFRANGLHLIRITDIEFREMQSHDPQEALRVRFGDSIVH
jgi:hypothetical protein